MSKDFGADYDPFNNNEATDFESAIFPVDIPESGKVIATPTDIMTISPDIRQPRRAVPFSIRGRWTGEPARALDVLEVWRVEVASIIAEPIDVQRYLSGRMDYDSIDNPLVDGYFDLLSLAGSIFREGLTNPITIDEGGTIETGERRWLAYHLLDHFADGDYSRIPARVVTGDLWRQASENGARRPLNAVGMARQLALLIMDMYQGDSGVEWSSYEDMVLPGESDRAYYAQVSNGKIWHIKRGFMQRVLEVTGLKSRTQVSQYRAILNVPDELWLQADAENWTEFRIRTEIEEPKPEPKADIERTPDGQNTPHVLTAVNTSPNSDANQTANEPENAPMSTTVNTSPDIDRPTQPLPPYADEPEYTDEDPQYFDFSDERPLADENADLIFHVLMEMLSEGEDADNWRHEFEWWRTVSLDALVDQAVEEPDALTWIYNRQQNMLNYTHSMLSGIIEYLQGFSNGVVKHIEDL